MRTTDTGGVKLIYNGLYNIDNGCNNSGTDTQISLSINDINKTSFAFNSNHDSLAYIGYMYGDIYIFNQELPVNGAYFGSDFTWNGTSYTLVDAVTTKNNTHHYTCNLTTADGTCATLRYYYYGIYYINLTGGDGIEEAITKMQVNVHDSDVKTQIDTWYSNNMSEYTSKLEDTIWCNDRSIGNNNGLIANGGDLTKYLYFGAYERSNDASDASTVKNRPSLACVNINDRFTVSSSNGNGALTYPVALLTSDEMVLAGGLSYSNNETFYLNNGDSYWSMSPYSCMANTITEFVITTGMVGDYIGNIEWSNGIRPSISLKTGTIVSSGTGTVTNPYVIE